MNSGCVLITGIGGFIGQNVAEYLVNNGKKVIGVYHNNKPEHFRGQIFSCDLSRDGIMKYLDGKKVDAIVHFAGQMRGDKVRDYLDNTVGSTRNLIDYAENTGVNTFIYVSSISVYGETLSEVNECSDRINPDDYGMTKYLCERMLEDSHIANRIVIRLPRTLGKGCDLSYPWIPKVTGQMLRNEDVYYMNPDLMYNNMLYVDDLSKFLLHILDAGDLAGFERFVLGAKGKMRILDILCELRKCLGSQSSLIEKQPVGRNKCYAIDATHAQKYGFYSREISRIIEDFAKDMLLTKEGV